MSRWLNSYAQNSFHNNWENFKNNYDEFDIKEITDTQIIDEYNRLGKVINFIDSYLKIIDPELNKENILNNLSSILNNAINNFNDFLSNKTLNYIKQTNNYIDNCVDSIKQLNILLPKISSRSISSMLKKYQDTINEVLEDINLKKIKSDTEEIYELKDKLIDSKDNIKDDIENLYSDFKDKYEEVIELHDKILIDGQDEISIKTAILNAKKDIANEIDTTKKSLTEANSKVEELEKFYIKIYGNFDKEQNKRVDGLEQELKTRKEELDKLEEEHIKTYSSLKEQIESLLPGATSVGLAKAYSDERSKFKKPIMCWNITFVVSLLVIATVSFCTLKDLNSIEAITKTILTSLPITLPLIWLAVYASKRRSENQRLDQEYAHKEAFAKSYMGYKKQIEELEEQGELLATLVEEIIKAISHNASQTLDKKHGDGTIIKELVSNLKEIEDTLPNKKEQK